jgi:hypothetical protein
MSAEYIRDLQHKLIQKNKEINFMGKVILSGGCGDIENQLCLNEEDVEPFKNNPHEACIKCCKLEMEKRNDQ